MRRAARAGDAPGFAAAAVSAMRVACAPHYPADPHALVGADVLALLPPQASPTPPEIDFGLGLPEPTGGTAPATVRDRLDTGWADLVRRFFTAADAARFGAAPADASALLPFEPEIEKLLSQLEVRLC